jgi:hypothetical protein
MTCVKICENCSFYDEIAPSNHFRADEFGLGMCTIQRDRLPLWAKDCCCETVVHGDWADCPTWMNDGVMVPELEDVEEGSVLAVVDIECELP